jgi:hypothetical protein
MKFLLASIKSLTIKSLTVKFLPVTLFTDSGFLIAACAFKVVPKPACDSEIVPKAG